MVYVNKQGSKYKQAKYIERAFDFHRDPKMELKNDEPAINMPASGNESDIPFPEM